jgi:hypothetical protein
LGPLRAQSTAPRKAPDAHLQAERLALELDGEHSEFADVTVLRDKLCRLDRLLPGLNVNVLLCKDTLILTTDVATAAARLVRLHVLLGSPNLVSLLHVAPQFLYAEVWRSFPTLSC